MPSYEQRGKDKLWSVRFREIDRDGVTQNKRLSGYKTKKEARQAYIDYVAEQGSIQDKTEDNRLLFDTLIDSYLEHQKTRVKESSFYDITNKINNRIRPFFAGRFADDVKPKDILEWQQSISEYSYRYKCSLRTLLTAIYHHGERYFELQNIMTRVEGFRNNEAPEEMQYWTPEEFSLFIAKVSDPAMQLYFRTIYIGGLRRGECEALQWRDIDFAERKIKISKTVTRKTIDAPYAITPPKNKTSFRTITMPQSICDDLAAYKKSVAAQLDHYMFGAEKPPTYRTVDRIFAAATEAAGVKKIRIHDLRHSCASLLISRGMSIVAVTERLGHKNVEQTLNTYSHLMPSEADRLASIFDGM
jgi:integrase